MNDTNNKALQVIWLLSGCHILKVVFKMLETITGARPTATTRKLPRDYQGTVEREIIVETHVKFCAISMDRLTAVYVRLLTLVLPCAAGR